MEPCTAIPYSGKEKYIFVSYSHEDEYLVFPVIELLARRGYRVWYDRGVTPGDDWAQAIAEKLDGCTVFMVMRTQAADASHNCRNEINLAVELKKEILCLQMDSSHMSLALRMQLGSRQWLKAAQMSTDEIVREIDKLKALGECRGEPDGSVAVIPRTKPAPEPKPVKKLPGTGKHRMKAEPVPEPESEPAQKPEPEPESEPAPKPAPGPEIEPAPKPDPEPEPYPAPKPEHEPRPEPAAGPKTDPGPGPGTECVLRPKPAPGPKAEPAPKKVPGPAAGRDTEYIPDPDDPNKTVFLDEDPNRTVLMDDPDEPKKAPSVPAVIRLATGEAFKGKPMQTVVGRDGRSADVVIPSPNKSISRSHFSAVISSGRYYIADEDSANGTYVNGEKLEKGKSAETGEVAQVRAADEDLAVLFGAAADAFLAGDPVGVLRHAASGEYRLAVGEGEILLGREHPWQCGCMDDKAVSREHAAIRREEDGFVLEDTSTNGTSLIRGGETSRLKRSSSRLEDGDTVVVNKQEFEWTVIIYSGE